MFGEPWDKIVEEEVVVEEEEEEEWVEGEAEELMPVDDEFRGASARAMFSVGAVACAVAVAAAL